MLIVIKIGGKVLENHLHKFALDMKMNMNSHEIILVHGGGVKVTEVASKLGEKQSFIISPRGFRSRYTTKETMEIFTMVMAGKINKKIVAALEKQGISSIGLSGIDGALVRARRKKRLIAVDERGRKKVIDGGYTGQIKEVDTDLLFLLLKNKYVPVIAPLALGEEYQNLNIDGDRMAAHIAGALKAQRLVLLTDVPGILVNDEVLSKTTDSELEKLLPNLGPGMITKAYAAKEAITLGVEEVIIAPGYAETPITTALKKKMGSVIMHG